MVELILLSPLFLVIAAALAFRLSSPRRPFHARVWSIIIAGAALAFLLPLGWGAWLPDLLFAPRRTLAETTSPSGHSFRVIQYWNRSDFYSTELHVTSPNAPIEVRTLDGDDSKRWSIPLSIDETDRLATVTLSGSRSESIHW